jgi:hypothetical protein
VGAVWVLLHMFGIDDMNSRWYAFWSGIGGDVSFLSAPLVLLRKNNCHYPGCWRLGRHPVDGTSFVVCRRHHPDDHPTAADIARKGAS